jgi:hypothetical protein
MATKVVARTRLPNDTITSVTGWLGLLAIAGFLTAGVTRADISLSSRDTFASTNEGWRIGSAGVQPTQVAAPGPDSQVGYLSHFSDGGGSNGKWLMWSDGTQWQGDYPAAGVTGIDLWANVDSGTSPVSMRIAFGGPGGWFASDPQSVTTGWNNYSFPIEAGNFSSIAGSGGSGSFTDTIGGVSRFQILAGTGSLGYKAAQGVGFLQAGTSVNTILIDDISAVPEPGVIALGLAASLAGYAVMVRRNRRRSLIRR